MIRGEVEVSEKETAEDGRSQNRIHDEREKHELVMVIHDEES